MNALAEAEYNNRGPLLLICTARVRLPERMMCEIEKLVSTSWTLTLSLHHLLEPVCTYIYVRILHSSTYMPLSYGDALVIPTTCVCVDLHCHGFQISRAKEGRKRYTRERIFRRTMPFVIIIIIIFIMIIIVRSLALA